MGIDSLHTRIEANRERFRLLGDSLKICKQQTSIPPSSICRRSDQVFDKQ